YVPQSKHAHLIAAPVNVFLSKRVPGKLEKLNFDMDEEDMESEEDISFGVGKVEDFSQYQMLDLYACVECGRCTDVCPASGTGKTPWVPAFAFSNNEGNQLAGSAGNEAAATMESVSLIGDIMTEEEISGCTTCRACEDACPVMNEHVDKIIDLRRYLVMTEGKMDSDIQRAVMNIERQGNPWGLSKKDRIKWRELDESVEIPTIKELKKEDRDF